jgi:hypothetical protein
LILGFAHLAFSTGDADKALLQFGKAGFRLIERYNKMSSSPAKWPLMARQATAHDLLLFSGTVAIEIVCHDTGAVVGNPQLDLASDRREIDVHVHDVARERSFFVGGLACVEDGSGLEARGAFPGWTARLHLIASDVANPAPPLDVRGFSCLAFYTSDLGDAVSHLLSLGGGDATEPFAIDLGARRFEVVMLRSPNGIIIELLKVSRP